MTKLKITQAELTVLAVKAIRNYLRKENGRQQKELYTHFYWKSGVMEDKSAVERHIENVEKV